MKKKMKYEKPKIVKISRMNFMFAYFENPEHKLACRQCSSCHGCRG